MSIFKTNLWLSGSSAQSDARSANSRVNNRVYVALLAGLILFGSGAKAQNVLINPGAETGDLTGWNVSPTGYNYVVSTNGTIPNSGTSNFLAHSGAWTFQMFDTTGTEGAPTASLYQDFAADNGSQWSASCWAICYASNYFSTAIAYMSVAFYDTNNNVLTDTNIPSATYGVYGSAVLDPLGYLGSLGYVITPPQATDASGWLYLPATNFYYGYTPPLGSVGNPAPGNEVESGYESPVPTTLTAPPGTVFVRYQLEFDNSADAGGDVYWDDCVLDKLVGSDPDITNPPVALTVYAGLPASFTVGQKTAYVGEKVSFQWQENGTNLPGPVNDINGKTTLQTLSFTNCQAVDQGLYDVVVTDINTHTSPSTTNSIRSVPVQLTVLTLTCLQKANVLGPNAGFENNPLWAPWEIFNGCYFATTNNTYDGITPVNVYDGNSVAEVGANGDRDNGFHHAFGTGANCTIVTNVTPGSWWKAGGWAYISSSNDFTAGNTCRLQIWFKDATGTAVPGTPTYESFKIYGLAYTNANMTYCCIDASSPDNGVCGLTHAQLPRDHWCYLAVSNVVDNSGIGLEDDLPYDTLPNGLFMVPTNTTPPVTQINYQVYEYCPQSTDVDVDDGQSGPTGGYLGNATDAVYWDDMQLFLVAAATNGIAEHFPVSVSVSGTNINLSFPASAGLDYSVLYKTNLTDATWSVLVNNITDLCTNTTVTVTDPITAQHRFYQVAVQ